MATVADLSGMGFQSFEATETRLNIGDNQLRLARRYVSEVSMAELQKVIGGEGIGSGRYGTD